MIHVSQSNVNSRTSFHGQDVQIVQDSSLEDGEDYTPGKGAQYAKQEMLPQKTNSRLATNLMSKRLKKYEQTPAKAPGVYTSSLLPIDNGSFNNENQI